MMMTSNTFGRSSRSRPRWLSLTGLGLVALLATACGGAGSALPGSGEEETPGPPPVSVQLKPSDGAKDVSPTLPITAKVKNGKITNAVLTNQAGELVAGAPSPDGKSWKSGEPLGYGKAYTLKVNAKGPSGPVQQRSVFHTVAPAEQTYVSMNPTPDETVGVGQPLAFYFSDTAPPPDKAAAEKAIRIQTEPAVEGAFYWYDDYEVHWRPKEYWKPGTQVTVDVNVYGKDLGNGVWGEEDRTANITIGDAVVLHADGASHQMSVEVNGVRQRTIPVSLGKPSFPSNNGTHVVTEHHETKLMDSTSFGLPLDQGGYRTEVKWAVRISNGGEFLHAAPWSVGEQGSANVSHGCINMSDADAKWLYDLLSKGDIVEITNAGGPTLEPTDGFGDWQVPWDQWLRGNR